MIKLIKTVQTDKRLCFHWFCYMLSYKYFAKCFLKVFYNLLIYSWNFFFVAGNTQKSLKRQKKKKPIYSYESIWNLLYQYMRKKINLPFMEHFHLLEHFHFHLPSRVSFSCKFRPLIFVKTLLSLRLFRQRYYNSCASVVATEN